MCDPGPTTLHFPTGKSRRAPRQLISVIALALAVIVPVAFGAEQQSSTPSKTGKPRTLLTVRGSIDLFAQDGTHIAWAVGCTLVIRDLNTHAQMRHAGNWCDTDGKTTLVLGGGRALWFSVSCGNSCYENVYTWAVGEAHASHLGEELVTDRDGGPSVSSLAADGDTLVYGVLVYSTAGCENCGPQFAGGQINRVAGRALANQLDIPPAALAANGSRIGVIPMEATGCACNSAPAWSPDGRLIAFSSRRVGPDWDISTVQPNGAALTVVTDNFRYDGEPDWSPDGAKLVFVTSSAIEVANADGTGERPLVTGCSDMCGSSPAWSPDGSRVAFAKYVPNSGTEIFTVSADGSGVTRLTQSVGAASSSPSWSPDGTAIAYTKTTYDGSEIWLMNTDGSNGRKLADGGAPTWAASGSIAFEKYDGHDYEIYAVNADGTNLRPLTDNLVDDYSPDWAPNSSRLTFVRMAQGKEEIYVMNADGSSQTRVTDTHPVPTQFPAEVRQATVGTLVSRFMPSGNVLAIALSPQFAAVLVQRGHAKRVELFDPTSGAPRGAVGVPRATYPALSIAGTRVVFRTKRSIRLLDAARRKTSLLSVLKTEPIGLSIEGRRVAWVESGKKHSRIRAIFLPVRP